MRLSCEKRSRVIELYIKHNLSNQKRKYHILSEHAKKEDIIISSRSVSDIVKKWENSQTVAENC